MDLDGVERVGLRVGVEFDKMGELVLDILARSERCRNDDHFLILKVLERLGEDIHAELAREGKGYHIVWRIKDLGRVSSFETITRCRRHVQNTLGLWLPTDLDVALKRRIREDSVRAFYGAGKKLKGGVI